MLEDKRTGVVRLLCRHFVLRIEHAASIFSEARELCLLKDALTIEPANEGRRTSSKDGSRCKRYESNVTKSSAYEAGKRFRDIVGKRTSLP